MSYQLGARVDRITKTVRTGLCHSCGACAAICPTDAISFRESVGGHLFPTIDELRCTYCGLCFKVCAGKLVRPTFRQVLPGDPFEGISLGTWVGKSRDVAVYAGGQSGGVVSQLLINLLESGEVDACAVVKMEVGNPPRPEVFLAHTTEEVLKAQRSKYCPVPMLQSLREARLTDRRLALVGLGCHFHGLKLLQAMDADLSSIVKVKIGLICAGALTLAAVDYLLGVAAPQPMNSRLVFRDKARTGYPGDVTVEDDLGNVSIVPKSERMAIKDIFTPARCRLCFDKMNVCADVTVGDPWGIEGIDGIRGESLVIARTVAGCSLVNRALEADCLSLRSVDYERALRGQSVDDKRADWKAYCNAWKNLGRELPGFYETVVAHTPQASQPMKGHLRRLLTALALDEQKSRAAVLSYVRRKLVRRRFRGYLLQPFRFARYLIQKVRRA